MGSLKKKDEMGGGSDLKEESVYKVLKYRFSSVNGTRHVGAWYNRH